MTRMIVIDASVAASWVIADEKSAAGRKLLDEFALKILRPITIPLFWNEFRNILVSNERRGRVRDGEPLLFLQEIRSIGIETRDMEHDALILSLSNEHALTAYDAAYLALAVQNEAMLATNDRQLARAAMHLNIGLRSGLNPL